MKIAIASDHAGWEDKTWLIDRLTRLGYDMQDFGTDSAESCDYPDYAEKAARAVTSGECERGILVCGTGIGMSLAANKINGIRAAACQTVEAAKLSRLHNDANMLCLGSRVSTRGVMEEVTDVWLTLEFEGGRHERRVGKIMALEQGGVC